jgi:site-specific DNA-methyltransferase (adenine-specific)
MGSFPFPRNGVVKIDYEFILLFKKPGDGPKPSAEQKEASRMSTEEWNSYFAGHWEFTGERQNGHLAMFPEELPRRLTKMFTFVGETVLDPFLGSGTTSLAARNLGRHSVGYEANSEFLPNIVEKVGFGGRGLFDAEPCIEVVERPGVVQDLDERRKRLPYLFQDPVKFDKKVDPRLMTFGSKISAAQ